MVWHCRYQQYQQYSTRCTTSDQIAYTRLLDSLLLVASCKTVPVIFKLTRSSHHVSHLFFPPYPWQAPGTTHYRNCSNHPNITTSCFVGPLRVDRHNAVLQELPRTTKFVLQVNGITRRGIQLIINHCLIRDLEVYPRPLTVASMKLVLHYWALVLSASLSAAVEVAHHYIIEFKSAHSTHSFRRASLTPFLTLTTHLMPDQSLDSVSSSLQRSTLKHEITRTFATDGIFHGLAVKIIVRSLFECFKRANTSIY